MHTFTTQLEASTNYKRLLVVMAENEGHAVLQWGRHFPSSVSSRMVTRILAAQRTESSFDSLEERTEEVIGWVNIIRHQLSIGPLSAKPLDIFLSSVHIVHMIVNTAPRLFINGGFAGDQLARPALDETIKNDFSAVLAQVLTDNLMNHLENSDECGDTVGEIFLEEELEQLEIAFSNMLSPEHKIVSLLRRARQGRAQ